MNSWRRALLYIGRRKKKSLLLFLVMWASLLSVMVAVGIRETSQAVTAGLKEKLSGYFTVTPNLEVDGTARYLNDDLCKEIVQGENLLTYNGNDVFYMSLPDVKLTPGRFTVAGEEEDAHAACFLASTRSVYQEQFYLDNLNLVEGEHLEEDDEGQALISTVLARDNGLEIGDTFQSVVTENYRGTNEAALGNVYTYQVKGIFQVKDESEPDSERAEFDFPENYIFIDIQTDRKIVSDLRGGEFDWYRNGVNFYIRDSAQFEKTLEEVADEFHFDTDGYEIEQNNGKYQSSAEPLERVSFLTGIFIVVMIVLGIVILYLILFLWMRDRKHEMGIYLAAGIGKKGIFGQLILESFLLYMAAAIAAGLCAATLSGVVGRMVFTGDTAGMTELISGHSGGIGYMMAATAAGFLVILAAVGMSFLTVVKMTPKEILSSN